MFFTNGLANLKKSPLAAISQYASHGRRMFVLPMLGLALTACQGEINVTGDLSDLGLENFNINGGSTSASTISGSVGDGPIVNAQIKITDATGAVIGTAVSDTTASYNISVPAGSVYPVVVTATGGTDVVTGTEPDFNMVSVVTDSSESTVNINPFSTLMVKTAQAMFGGLTTYNLSVAKLNVLDQLSFGLDPALVPDPITTAINGTNVASIIKASETFGEAIRRTRSTLIVSGSNYTGDEIIDTIARDMTDNVLDGRGPGANAQIAATANIEAGQVLVEALVNRLNVNGADATTPMDMAINLSVPSATMSTADVVITERMLDQARTAVAAAQAYSPSSNLSAVAVILAGLSGNSLAADIETVLPANPGAVFNEVITQLPLSTNNQLESINATVRSGVVEPVVETSSSRPWEDLVNEAVGFGRHSIGGKGGDVCWVNNLNASGAGSFTECVLSTDPKWIRFAVSGVIDLQNTWLYMKSNKTIDGRGADITISRGSLRIENDEDIIIHNIKFANMAYIDGGNRPFVDISRNSRRIWVDHVAFLGGVNDAIQVGNYTTTLSPTDVTVSWSRWDNTGKSFVIGFRPMYTDDKNIKVTLHHNYWANGIERHPLVVQAKVHMFNNYMHNWTWQGACAAQEAQIASDNNIFEPGANTQNIRVLRGSEQCHVQSDLAGYARSQGDLFEGGAVKDENQPEKVFDPRSYYTYNAETASASLKSRIVNGAGWQNVPAP